MNFETLNNKSVFVNGASSFLGKRIAEALTCFDLKLFITDTNKEALQYFEHDFPDMIEPPITYQIKESNPFQIETSIDACFQNLKSIDYAVNNFTISNASSNILDCTNDYWNGLFRINLSKFFLFLKYELSLFIGLNNNGRIINTFSFSEGQIASDAHGICSILSSIAGLTEAVNCTYSKSGIKIYSFFPEIGNAFLFNDVNRLINIPDINSPDPDYGPIIKEILGLLA